MRQQITVSKSTIAIATKELTKRYDRYIAVKELDLCIPKGEIYGLMGANGAGKSTLLKMLAAAESPTKGEIYLNGDRLLLDASSSNLKKYLGYLPDRYSLYEDLTVWDYLDYFARLYKIPARRRRVRIYEVLELVQLENKCHSLIPTLSQGMKQRLGLARTIIHEPIVLLLDEPISGLDSRARTQFNSIIQVLQEAGMTIIIASPILSNLIEVCTTIGIMEYGFLIDSIDLSDVNFDVSSQQIIVTTLGNLTTLEQELSQNSLVKKWTRLPNRNSLKIIFAGGKQDSVKLLRSLIVRGLPITEFQPVEPDLETILLDRQNSIN